MLLLDQAVSTAAVAPSPARVAARPALRGRRAVLLVLGIILLAGCFLRLPSFVFVQRHPTMQWLAPLHPIAAYQELGFDEGIYRAYVSSLILHGFTSYPDLADTYLQEQKSIPMAVLPPTRFFYIAAAYGWHVIWDTGPRTSLNVISSVCSMLLLVLSAVFAWRMGGRAMALGVTALMAFAPTQIHMSQHALIDGVFAFWATMSLWLLWENLQRPNRWPWLAAYAGSLAVMVLTKENAMFAYLGILVLIAANHWLRFGRLTSRLCLVTVLGPLLGVVILVFACGGLGTTIEIYRLFVSKVSVLKYAIRTGDGPWYRYLVDMMVVSPVVLALALGGIFRLHRSERPGLYLLLFVGASFLVMVNIRYGMNLRYTNMWDFPLRYLAVFCLWQMFPRNKAQVVWMSLCLAAVCAFELRQYHVFFVDCNLYELVPEDLLRAVKMLK